MFPALAFALLVGQDSAAAVAQPLPFRLETSQVAQTARLAMTPTLDGTIAADEWDPLTSNQDARSYLQWEPGMLYLAAVVPMGSVAKFSLDLNADGWLNGDDNLEVTLSERGISGRVLENSRRDGPAWLILPDIGEFAKITVRNVGLGTVLEAAMPELPGGRLVPREGTRFGVRFDAASADAMEAAAFLPRQLTEVTLATQRAAGFPADFYVNVQDGFPTLVPGDDLRLRFTFRGDRSKPPTRLVMRGGGALADVLAQYNLPFPALDRKNRAIYDYHSRLDPTLSLGYRTVVAVVTGADGVPAVAEASFRIAKEIDVFVRNPVQTPNSESRLRLSYGVRSNVGRRLTGSVAVVLPDRWRAVTGTDRGFSMPRRGFVSDKGLEIEVPPGTVGVFPIRFQALLGDRTIEDTALVRVLPTSVR
jgi:hypothetical protein